MQPDTIWHFYAGNTFWGVAKSIKFFPIYEKNFRTFRENSAFFPNMAAFSLKKIRPVLVEFAVVTFLEYQGGRKSCRV